MSQDNSDFVLRDPRYIIADGKQPSVHLSRCEGHDPQMVVGVLVDFSRKGMQVRTLTPLKVGEQVVAKIIDPDSATEIALDGVVQWQRPGSADAYSVGCQFSEDVNWEVLGELFLNGILDQTTAV